MVTLVKLDVPEVAVTLPVKSPVTSPVTLPVRLPVTLPITFPVSGPTSDVPVIVVPVIAAGVEPPITTLLREPPPIAAVVTEPRLDTVAPARLIVPVAVMLVMLAVLRVDVPVTPKVPATVAFSSTVSVSIVAVPSIYRLFHCLVLVPRLTPALVSGTRFDVNPAATAIVSSVDRGSPIVTLPAKDVVPLTVRPPFAVAAPVSVVAPVTLSVPPTDTLPAAPMPPDNHRSWKRTAGVPKSTVS